MPIIRDGSMSSFDIYVMIKEIKSLERGIIDNIYQFNEIIGLKIRTNTGPFFLLIEPAKRIHLTRLAYNWQATNFIKMIRKHLVGARISNIDQYKFDRIVIITLNNGYQIIAEILSRGNFIIVRENKVLFALKHVHMRDRAIFPGSEFKYPPRGPDDPRLLNKETLRILLSKSKSVSSALAKLGLGRKYAYEICYRCHIDTNASGSTISDYDLTKILEEISNLFNEAEKTSKYYVYLDTNAPLVFSPIILNFLEKNGVKKIAFNTFSEAVEYFYTQLALIKPSDEILERLEREKRRLEKRIENQKQRITELNKQLEKIKRTIAAIYNNYTIIQSILETIRNAKKNLNLDWEDIIKRIEEGKKKGIREALIIKEITKDGKIFISLDPDVLLELNINKSIHDVEKELFDDMKKIEAKIDRASVELEKSLNELKSLERKIYSRLEEAKIIIKEPPRKWYHSFRWFISSDGFLVIAGRDAQSNERIVKRYMENNDIFLHSEIHGGAVVLIKNPEKKEIPENTLKEAAIFAACYSKAWQKGLSSIDVFWTTPNNVSVTPPSGQYLPLGSFIIKKKNYLKNIPLHLAIGVKIEKHNETYTVLPIAGPPNAIKKMTNYYVVIAPGNWKKSDTAKKIVKIIIDKSGDDPIVRKALHSLKIDRIIELIPGPSRIIPEDDYDDANTF